VIEQARLEAARPVREGREVHFVARPSEETLISIDRSRSRDSDLPTATVTGMGLDVIFPMLHGPYGEDGTIQGLLELANIAYVGGGVLASAVGMDKAVMTVLFAARGLPVCPYRVFLRHEWETAADGIVADLEKRLAFPMFVKPANLGSSVGISKAKTDQELAQAMDHAFEFDRKAVIEAAVPNAREIECAVLGNDDPAASVPGEIVPSREFYDYQAKYLEEGSQCLIPAPLTEQQIADVRELAIRAFRAVDAAGMSRVDFLMSRDNGALFLNEVNTIPGFTTISMYPKMWEASGLSYADLLDRLIALALERHTERQQLKTSVT
jgi:D-alanine-D-alanine ligase